MSEKRRDGKKRDDKRRDTKGRVLRNGESQEKDGRYTYKYTDASGERKTVRSWRLVKTDMTPPGKHPTLSLREMENDIQAEFDGTVTAVNVNQGDSVLEGAVIVVIN